MSAQHYRASKLRAKASDAKKYRDRDVYSSFFWPAAQQSKSKPKYTSKSKPKKRQHLTDKQRQSEAHAHFILHHGSAADAARFMHLPSNVKNTSDETLTALKQMLTPPPLSPTPAQEKATEPSDKESAWSQVAPIPHRHDPPAHHQHQHTPHTQQPND